MERAHDDAEPTRALFAATGTEHGGDRSELDLTLGPWLLTRDEEGFFASWGRYEYRSILGSGGMGRVFRAWDSVLNRQVAVKVLHRERTELLERFRVEAQSQARVEHPHVAKVFDVGTHDGRTFLVMQCIEGPNLRELAPKLGLEEKLRIMAQVAEGVHAAHRSGIVHRDLKPSNVLVESIDGAGWHAYVTDFGLARGPEQGDLTVTGTTVGTPAYMAPEQIQGRGPVNRASDVYSLGVTLFELLTGTLPFKGETPMELLASALQDEPRALRSVDARLSPDLETIVATCLAHDPARRYASARALGEDLQRALDGEPILARPPGLPARTRRWLRRHPVAAASALTAALTLSGFGFYLARQQHFHQRQLAFAQRCDLLATEGEAVLRQAWMMREHDLSAEKGLVQQKITALEAELAAGGRSAEGPALAALARLHLALDDTARAQDCLERAWAHGYRPRAVAEALAAVLGTRYHEALQQQLLPGLGRELTERRRRELEARFRDQALRLLGASAEAEGAGDALQQARQALLHRQFGRAFALVDAHALRFPWQLEARRLQAVICALEAREAIWDRGDLAAASGKIDLGLAVCREALAEARSSPQLLGAQAQLLFQRVNAEKLQGRLSVETAQAAVAAADRTLRVDPTHAPALRTRSMARLAWGEDLVLNSGEDARPMLLACIQDGEASLRAGLPSVQQPELLGGMMVAQIRLADMDLAAGRDPGPRVEAARALFTKVLALDPGHPTQRARFSLALHDLATWRHVQGEDPGPALDEALRIYREGYAVAPESVVLCNNHAFTSTLRADLRLATGQAEGAELEEGLQACRKGLAINPRVWQLQVNVGFLHALRGAFKDRRGEDPQPDWAEAARWFAQAELANPRHARGLGCQAKFQLWRARSARAAAQAAALRLARSRAEAALALDPQQLDAAEVLAALAQRPGAPPALAAHPAVAGLRARFPRHPVFRPTADR